jgi:signal transduction histidine kinase
MATEILFKSFIFTADGCQIFLALGHCPASAREVDSRTSAFMRWILYLRLVTLTAGTLLPFFWMVVILGHRRQRNFERIFFFLCLALTCLCGTSLLALNAQLYYGNAPDPLLRFAWIVLCIALWAIPSLLIHLHAEYGLLRGITTDQTGKWFWRAFAYVPMILLIPSAWKGVSSFHTASEFERPSLALGGYFQLWLLVAVIIATFWQWSFRANAPDKQQRKSHQHLAITFFFLSFLLLQLFFDEHTFVPGTHNLEHLLNLVALWAVIGPLGVLVRDVQRLNFLQIGRQRNLIYAVFGVFIALLYLSFVRRASLWLDPYFPPEASAALLLFLPVVFFEPLQRMIRRLLQSTAQKELDSVHPLAMSIHSEASKGDVRQLVGFIEREVKNNSQFESVQLTILEPPVVGLDKKPAEERNGDESFSVYRPGRLNGVITVRPHGAMISGEAAGAMKFLSESIAGAIDMCIVLEQKLELERELAERERMALVGQMAASISHNLKNPLGSIKTILQVQMESTELPAALRGETQMVLDEINRLSAKLNQLLQFSRPGVRPSSTGDHCNLVAVATTVVEVLCREAESRGISLELAAQTNACEVACPAETANDILSNVVLNAIEAVGRDGRVSVGFRCEAGTGTVAVEDDGPGIAPELHEKIVQPFFTTKPRGTGLGLAIVARRLEEVGGKLEIKSPMCNGHGTRFLLTFPGYFNHLPPGVQP